MENIEQVKPDGAVEPPPIKLTNLIQFDLIQESHDDPVVWIARNSENFRKLLVANPNMIEDYEKVKDDKNKKAAFIKFVASALEDIVAGERGVN